MGHEITVSPIPDSLAYEKAVVLPLAISTAVAGFHQNDFLALPYPTIDAKPTGKTILIWGGASSVGSTAIQLAKGSGLEVISTASKRNLGYVKALGAQNVLDYSEPTVVENIVGLLKGTEFVGAYDAISSPETLQATAEIVSRLGGGKIAIVLRVPAEGLPSNVTTVGGKKVESTYVCVEMLIGSQSRQYQLRLSRKKLVMQSGGSMFLMPWKVASYLQNLNLLSLKAGYHKCEGLWVLLGGVFLLLRLLSSCDLRQLLLPPSLVSRSYEAQRMQE